MTQHRIEWREVWGRDGRRRQDGRGYERRVAPSRASGASGFPVHLMEEGSAFLHLTAGSASGTEPDRKPLAVERVDVIVIGAGQAGLSVGYHLQKSGVAFLILNADERVGDTWRHRWDSLRLFTPARFDGLDGMPFPAPPRSFPTKDEMADYLESYAKRFALPVVNGARVERLRREGDLYVVEAKGRRFEAKQVVVAMASYQKPRIPEFARNLGPEIVQIDSKAYRRPSQLREGAVLVVGAGNSGAEIALDVARGRKVWMSGRDVGHLPLRIQTLFSQVVVLPALFRLVFHRLLTVDTPFGRKARPRIVSQGGPLIRAKPRDLAAAGVERVARLCGVKDGKPLLEDGMVLDASNVIWCAGFHPGFSWIELPILDAHGEPRQVRGVVESEPGLFFVGLHFLYAFSSTMIHGVGRDAKHVAGVVARRLAEATARQGSAERRFLAGSAQPV